MNFAKDAIENFKEESDKRFANVCLIMFCMMALISFLGLLGVYNFNLSNWTIATCIVSLVVYILPAFFYILLDYHNDYIRYSLLGLLCLQTGLLYTVFSYHSVMLFVFPLVISLLFCNRRYVWYTICFTLPIIIISHYLALVLDIIPNEPLGTVLGVTIYGVIPRTLEFIALSFVCLYVSTKTRNLVYLLADKTEELLKDQKELMLSLSQVIEAQVEKNDMHIVRVAEYTAILCIGMGYSEEDTWKASLASMIHDVGNLYIPKEILLKPDKLTEEEFDIVKNHIEYGFEILENGHSELMDLAKVIALEHHERWDGLGYLHKRGEEINKFARCVALADVFDTLMNRRPYKEKYTEQAAYLEIVTDKGKHFDPRLVDVFACHYKDFLEISRKYPNPEDKSNNR